MMIYLGKVLELFQDPATHAAGVVALLLYVRILRLELRVEDLLRRLGYLEVKKGVRNGHSAHAVGNGGVGG